MNGYDDRVVRKRYAAVSSFAAQTVRQMTAATAALPQPKNVSTNVSIASAIYFFACMDISLFPVHDADAQGDIIRPGKRRGNRFKDGLKKARPLER